MVTSSLQDVVRTVEAMTAIPGLPGGFACFDDDLKCVGWDDCQYDRGTVWVEVPDTPDVVPACVEAGIDERRRELLRLLEHLSSRECSDPSPRARNIINADLGRLMAACEAVA